VPIFRLNYGATALVLAVCWPWCGSAADQKKPTCVQLQKKYSSIGLEELDKIHRMFGQPSEVRQRAYGPEGLPKEDLLVYDLGGCYFFLAVNGNGGAHRVDDGFHYRASELVGGSGTPQKENQASQLDIVAASLQQQIRVLEDRMSKLEATLKQTNEAMTALRNQNSQASAAPSRPSAGRPVTGLTSPLPSGYLGTGGGHWIQEVSSNGRFITLEDGSLWDIQAIDQVDTALWLPVTNITVRVARTPSGDFKYILLNTEDGEQALAKYLGLN